MIIYHYSSKDFNGWINPDFFGDNSYSDNSARLSGIKRSYFYTDKNKPEASLKGSKYIYISNIQEKKLYNITDDKKGIVKNLRYNQDIYTIIKSKGYSGIISKAGVNYIIVIFKAIKINKRLTLTASNIYAIL